MSASPEELIAINSLLIEREAAFARVHSAESQINALLGGDYPFAAPEVALPSSIRKKATKAKKAKKKAAPIKPRRLNDNEVGYKLKWSQSGNISEQTLTDLRQVSILIQEPLPNMRLEEITTIDLDGNALETLFPAE